ncbi:tat (twin-arginine translocation) pathway signal sequence [Rhodoferax koreense]|uniref:Tat (Twin-arginine translocation) pathway signal sequence n=1 Tax=Rhodoferax koreensis TaxID=1842727 RepID=A0A1P8JSM7_9BURK|nr:twin-arginine translocation signal domain-containing protein [Rhodoferax koreense]APW36735.1 tat (twin-arginine translocation) pathway signal sequence [Rhodoferax koreense]
MRVISIAEQSPTHGDCADEGGPVPKLAVPLARREFLKGSGLLFGTLATGSLLAGLAPSSAWALELQKLSSADGTTLMAMGRVLYPHQKLPDAVYALLAKDLDAKAAADAGAAKLLQDGVAWLDTSAGGSFAKASATRREEIVRSMEGTAFFAAVRGQCVTSLYDNDMAFAVFGYPGSAWEKGGYITRGFQDLKWLPAPSKEASPPPYMG